MMPDPLPIAEIRSRASALRLRAKPFAFLSGLRLNTVYDAMEGRCQPKPSTLQKLTDGLLAEERAQLARLATLHPHAKV